LVLTKTISFQLLQITASPTADTDLNITKLVPPHATVMNPGYEMNPHNRPSKQWKCGFKEE